MPFRLMDPCTFNDPDNSVDPDKVDEYIIILNYYISSKLND